LTAEFWQKEVYSNYRHVNRYPFDRVVSVVMSSLRQLPAPLSALDLGCGTGNHLKFLAENGFETVGVEQSSIAASISTEFLSEHNLTAKIIQGDITNINSLSFDRQFSLILDRGSLTHNPLDQFIDSLDQISRHLMPGGIFLSYFFSRNHSSVHHATELSPSFFSNYVIGDFRDCPAPALFLSNREAIDIFSRFFSVNSLSEITVEDCINGNGRSSMYECICSAL